MCVCSACSCVCCLLAALLVRVYIARSFVRFVPAWPGNFDIGSRIGGIFTCAGPICVRVACAGFRRDSGVLVPCRVRH